MKRELIFSFLALSALSLKAQITETSTDAVKNMGVGWNLGNTLDANGAAGTDFSIDSYWGQQTIESETYWGQPHTKPELFKMMKNAGYGAIRVPVTWYNHMDKDGNVNKEWMARVHEIVDYVIDNGLYCIINVHHDTGADSENHGHWIKSDTYQDNKIRFEYLWQQIAEEFKDYGKELLFEGYNEMLDSYSSWCFASFAAKGSYNEDSAKTSYEGINGYAQSFVDVVRATGGNNASRNLIVNTYAAANGYGNWNKHLLDPLTQMNLPKDQEAGHIIFEVHAYPNITNNGKNRTIADIKKEVDGMIKVLNDNLVSKGAPVIFGEWGTSNVDAAATDYDVRRDLMFQFVDYFIQQTKANDMGTFFWMGLTDGNYRSMPAFSQPDLAERIAKAYHGAGFKGEYPEPQKESSYDLVDKPMKFMNWGEPRLQIGADYFKSIGENAQLTLTYTFVGNDEDIQLFYGDWKNKPDFTVGGNTYEGDYFPHVDHADTETVTSVFSFSKEACQQLSRRGLIIFGHNFTVTKAVLSDSTSSIEQICTDDDQNAIFDLTGLRVSQPQKGFYIMGGKKVFVK